MWLKEKETSSNEMKEIWVAKFCHFVVFFFVPQYAQPGMLYWRTPGLHNSYACLLCPCVSNWESCTLLALNFWTLHCTAKDAVFGCYKVSLVVHRSKKINTFHYILFRNRRKQRYKGWIITQKHVIAAKKRKQIHDLGQGIWVEMKCWWVAHLHFNYMIKVMWPEVCFSKGGIF